MIERRNPFLGDFEGFRIDPEDLHQDSKIKQFTPEDVARILEEIENMSPEELAAEMSTLMRAMRIRRREEWEIKVTPEEWAMTHPFQLKTGGDRFYAELANKLMAAFYEISIDPMMPVEMERVAAISLAAYLEDVVSELGVWSAVRNMYRERFGRRLPFFDADHEDYFDDDLNLEDIKLLIWQATNRCGQPEGRLFSPMSDAVTMMAEKAYDILVDAFDNAPVATRVKDRLNQEFRKNDFYGLRTMALWLVADNPLTAPPFVREEMALAIAEMEENEVMPVSQQAYLAEAERGLTGVTSMLGCRGFDLVRRMAEDRGSTEVVTNIRNLEVRPYMVYDIMRVDNKTVTLTAGEREYITDRSSIGNRDACRECKGCFATLVRWGDVWMANGVTSLMIEVPDKMRGESIRTTQPTREMNKVMSDVVRRNRGRRVFYCADEREVSEVVRLATPRPMDWDYEPDNLLLLVSDTEMPVLLPDGCDYFSDRANPYYNSKMDREDLAEESLAIITGGQLADDVAAYIQEKRLLPHASIYMSQGKREGKALVQENLRFLAGFYRTRTPNFDSDDDDSDDYDD